MRRRLTLVATKELDGVDEAGVEAARPPHPGRSHASPGAREPGHVAGGGQTEGLPSEAEGAIAAEGVGEHAVEPPGARQHPVVRGLR
jgi:hypothetical protein